MARKKQFYSADEAIELLKIAKGTLYSYVSRGLVRSEEEGGKTRARRYLAVDVDALVERKRQRREPERAAKAALNWGAPVLESALTSIEEGRLYYRGQDAISLATKRTFEEVASLLWSGELAGGFGGHVPGDPSAGSGLWAESSKLWEKAGASIKLDGLSGDVLKPLEAFQVLLPALGAADLTAYTLERSVIIRTAWRILGALTALISGELTSGKFAPGELASGRLVDSAGLQTDAEGRSIAGVLRQAWTPDLPEAELLFNAALILCADHELNVSSFTVRCVASAGASPYAGVIAGLSALQGHRHGGQSELVELLFKEIETFSARGSKADAIQNAKMAALEQNARTVVANRLKRGERIPGFGQPLYPEGDPRYCVLRRLAHQFAAKGLGGSKGQVDGKELVERKDPTLAVADAIVDVVTTHVGIEPNLDMGLTVLSKVLGLPDGAPLVLFALGRTAGWIGHYIEQVETGQLIRPRATYTGIRAVPQNTHRQSRI